MTKIDKTNYELYKNVYEVFWQHYSEIIRIESNLKNLNFKFTSPVAILADVEKKSQSLALRALKAGISDMFAMTRHAPQEFKNILDTDLKLKGLPGYFTLCAEANNMLQLVLKQNVIRSTEQYYFIIEILNDTTSEITEPEREILNSCVSCFEAKATGNQSRAIKKYQ